MARSRKTLRINQEKFKELLKKIATHGIHEQGFDEAVRNAKEICYWQKGGDRIPLTDQEAGNLLT